MTVTVQGTGRWRRPFEYVVASGRYELRGFAKSAAEAWRLALIVSHTFNTHLADRQQH